MYHLPPSAEKARYELHENDADSEGYRRFLRRFTEHLTPRLSIGGIGLDYGAGPAPVLASILDAEGYRMTVYDPYFSPDGPWEDARYDFITCTETAEHFAHPAREFRRFDRLLRPGGWIGVMTRRLERLERRGVTFEDWHYRRDETHVCFYDRTTMNWIGRKFRWRVLCPVDDVTLFHKPRLLE